MGGQAAGRARCVAPRGEHQVLVADPASGGKQSLFGEVYSAQDVFQTKLTALIDAYKAECDRMQSGRT